MNDRRRPGSSGGGPRAASPAVAVGVAIVAALLGFFILKQFDNKDETKKTGTEAAAGESDTATGDTTGSPATVLDANGNPVPQVIDPTITTPPPVVSAAARPRGSYQIVVANASKVAKTAAGMTTAMTRDGFSPLPPTNAIEAVVPPPLAVTRVFFAAGFEAEAKDVATYLGVAVTEPLVDPSPVGPDSAGASIVVALGVDLAGKVPPGAAPVIATGAAAVVPAAGASPNDTTTTVA